MRGWNPILFLAIPFVIIFFPFQSNGEIHITKLSTPPEWCCSLCSQGACRVSIRQFSTLQRSPRDLLEDVTAASVSHLREETSIQGTTKHRLRFLTYRNGSDPEGILQRHARLSAHPYIKCFIKAASLTSLLPVTPERKSDIKRILRLQNHFLDATRTSWKFLKLQLYKAMNRNCNEAGLVPVLCIYQLYCLCRQQQCWHCSRSLPVQ